MWQGRFAGDPAILNRSILLDGEPHQVIGVLPAGSFDRGQASFWKPLDFAPEQRTRNYHWLGAVGRLKRRRDARPGAKRNARRQRQPRAAAAGVQERLAGWRSIPSIRVSSAPRFGSPSSWPSAQW